ncbi:MAG: ABC transporter substrate-binding protein, partial [Nitrospinota bacterium]
LDDLTWEVKLRPGVKFHNGEPFTAHTVKFNLERVLNPAQKSPARGNWTWLKEVRVIDDHTVHLISYKPYPLIFERLTTLELIPQHYAQEKGDDYIATHPVGTGPYKFVEWIKGQRLVLEVNTDYWGKIPEVKRVIFRAIPETATQIAELLSGGVDIIRTVPPDQIPVIEASPNAHISAAPILRVVFLMPDVRGRASQTPLMDARVRRAIAHAVDVEGIMQHILGGYAVRTPAVVNPLHFGYDPAIEPIPYAPEKAKALLAEAGYPEGFSLNLNSYSGSVVSVRQVVEAIMGNLAQVGIRVKNTHYEDVGTYAKNARAGKLQGITLFSWGSGSVFDADALLYPLLVSSEPFSYVKDPDLDRWLKQARETIDRERRKQLYSQVQRRIIEQTYWIPMYAQYAILGISNRINYEATGDEIIKVFEATWKE